MTEQVPLISELRSNVILRPVALVYMDEHVVEQVDARKDDLTLIQFPYMLDRVIIKVALDGMDLIVEHEPVDKERTYLTKEDRRYILRILCRQVKEYTLLTSLSCKERQSAVILLIGISGLRISVDLIDKEYEGADIVLCDNKITYEVDDHSSDTF